MSDNALSTEPRRCRVLAVTSELPWPLNSGGHIRTFHLMKAIAAATDLRVVCPVVGDQSAVIEALAAAGIAVVPVPVGPRTILGEARKFLGAVVRREPYVMYRRHAWPAVRAAWLNENRMRPADVWYCDHLDSYLYANSGRARPPVVLDLHNVYSLLARRTADEQTHPVKRAFLRRQAVLLDRLERSAAKTAAALFAVSSREADHFRSLGGQHVHTVPNGVDCIGLADLPTGRAAQPPTVLFLGTMSWGPNAAAAKFLIEIFPQVRERLSDARLIIVGRDPPHELRALGNAPGVVVAGGVPEVKPYLAEASILAVPLDAGGGTRLKILEAFAAGLPVVSTAVGAEGIEAREGEHFVRAERPHFANAMVQLLADPDRGAKMAVAARVLAREVYDWSRIGSLAVDVIFKLSRPHRGQLQ